MVDKKIKVEKPKNPLVECVQTVKTAAIPALDYISSSSHTAKIIGLLVVLPWLWIPALLFWFLILPLTLTALGYYAVALCKDYKMFSSQSLEALNVLFDKEFKSYGELNTAALTKAQTYGFDLLVFVKDAATKAKNSQVISATQVRNFVSSVVERTVNCGACAVSKTQQTECKTK